MSKRTAEEAMTRYEPAVAGGAGKRVVVVAPFCKLPVRLVAGRVVGAGTANGMRPLIGLSEDALRTWAARHGWRLIETGR